jgi:hypothetical protein
MPDQPNTAPVAYSDGKGTLNLYCLACPRPPEVTIALTVNLARACTWPACLTPNQHTELAAQVTAAEHGQHRPAMPDQRAVCGCTEATPTLAPVDPALQQRTAAAVRTIPDGARPRTTDEWAALVTRAVLAELRPELERAAHAGRLEIALRANQTAALEATERAEAAEAALARIRDLAATTHDNTTPGRSDYDIGRHNLAGQILATLDTPDPAEEPTP